MVYTQELEDVTAAREIIFAAALQSQQVAERRPFTIVALAVKFNYAIEELGAELHPGVAMAQAPLTLKQSLLDKAFEEFDDKCTNKSYCLSTLQREAIRHLILHSTPRFMCLLSKLMDQVPEKAVPYKLKILQTKRWVIGGGVRGSDIWSSILQMDAEKQVILAQCVNHEASWVQLTVTAVTAHSIKKVKFEESYHLFRNGLSRQIPFLSIFCWTQHGPW